MTPLDKQIEEAAKEKSLHQAIKDGDKEKEQEIMDRANSGHVVRIM